MKSLIYKSRLIADDFIKDFTSNVDFTKLYKLRIESTIYIYMNDSLNHHLGLIDKHQHILNVSNI